MIHHYAYIYPKNKQFDFNDHEMINKLLDATDFNPEEVCINLMPCGGLLLIAVANASVFGYEKGPYTISEKGAVALSGLPTICDVKERFSDSIPEVIFNYLIANNHQKMYSQVGGDWGVLFLYDGIMKAFSGFTGHYTPCYIDTVDYFAVGNNPAQLALLVNHEGKDKYDIASLSWLLSSTMIVGHDTIYKGVKKVPPGSYIEFVSGNFEINKFAESYDSPLTNMTSDDKYDYISERVDLLVHRLDWLLGRGLNVSSQLTGGLDSRAILALLQKIDGVEKLTRVETFGSPDNGDRIVSEIIMDELGLSHKHLVKEGNKSNSDFPVDRIAEKFRFVGARYDGNITPFDGAWGSASKPASVITLNGGGAGIYKDNGFLSNGLEHSEITCKVLNWGWEYNKLGVVSADFIDYQESFVSELVKSYRERGVSNIDRKYFIDQRLTNWASSLFQKGSSSSFAPMLDIGLSRLVFSGFEISDDIHFEIMRRCDSRLLNIPFHNRSWKGVTQARASHYCNTPEPIVTDKRANYPWQFRYFEAYKDELIQYIIDSGSEFLNVIDLDALSKIKGDGLSKYNSADIKMLYGAVMAVNITNNCCLRKKDFSGCWETKFFGNYSRSFAEFSNNRNTLVRG